MENVIFDIARTLATSFLVTAASWTALTASSSWLPLSTSTSTASSGLPRRRSSFNRCVRKWGCLSTGPCHHLDFIFPGLFAEARGTTHPLLQFAGFSVPERDSFLGVKKKICRSSRSTFQTSVLRKKEFYLFDTC